VALTLTYTAPYGTPRALHIDAEILAACQKGDVDAFRQLFESYKSRVYSIAVHFSADPAIAHDITQQVFVTLYTSIQKFRHEAQFDTWLYRIVVNTCLHEHRRRRRFVPFDTVPEPRAQGGDETLESAYLRREEIGAVRLAIATLKPKLRVALVLKHFEGLSYDEMAAILGCSAGTVASRLNRARSSLAKKLAHLRPS
jgi:RNA polymerase sigma-70 factor (ECF subfamily)